MGKRSNLYEIYFGPADSKLGQGYGQIKNGPLGSQKSLGGNYGIYDEPDKYDVEEDDLPEELEEESYIDGLLTAGFHAVDASEMFGEEVVGYSLY